MTIEKNNNITINAPIFWGIVNITPDSFSDGGLFYSAKNALEQIYHLKNEGAHYIDIGAFSSRPNNDFISAEEEWQRLEPLFEQIDLRDKDLYSCLSIDTWRADIAQKALEKNIFCINDISAFSWDEGLLDVLVHYKPYYVLMHCTGKAEDIHIPAQSENIVEDVYAFFAHKLELLEKRGFPKEKILLDPGIGFGKNLEQNLALMNAGARFAQLGCPLMAAVSRKSWLRELFSLKKAVESSQIKGQRKVLDRLTSIASLSLNKHGFKHHRLHNVAITRQAFIVEEALNSRG